MKLYETDGHCAAFTATVLSCEAGAGRNVRNRIGPDGLFPEGGGQSSDRGTLGGSRFCASERMPNDPKYIMRLRSRLRPEVR